MKVSTCMVFDDLKFLPVECGCIFQDETVTSSMDAEGCPNLSISVNASSFFKMVMFPLPVKQDSVSQPVSAAWAERRLGMALSCFLITSLISMTARILEHDSVTNLAVPGMLLHARMRNTSEPSDTTLIAVYPVTAH